MPQTNASHDPSLRSWIDAANDPGTDFPIQNLPLCVVDRGEGDARICTAIGESLVDLLELGDAGLLGEPDDEVVLALQGENLNLLMEQGPEAASVLRRRLQSVLRHDNDTLRDRTSLRAQAIFPREGARFLMPVRIGDYTDFYACINHARNVGSMFRPDNPLLPNYTWVPIGYHGRASSVVISGTPVRRPHGQVKADDQPAPAFAPSAMLDHELEFGVIIGQGNALGTPVPLDQAWSRVFGACLVNDWSARDIQKWEYQPLGPFLAKNFATTISPFVVTREALAPFHSAALTRGEGEPRPLPHLFSESDQREGGLDVTLEVFIQSEAMRKAGRSPMLLSRGSLRDMYWTFAQIIAHHTSNGCNLQPGDLVASGTISGSTRDSRGCMLELTWDGPGAPGAPAPGRTPVRLPTGEERRFLGDGDEIIIRAACERPGFRRIGFGECRGVILPAQR